MLKNINLPKVLKALVISLIFINGVNILFGGDDIALNTNFFISLLIYSTLSYIALYGYELNKLVGLFLFIQH